MSRRTPSRLSLPVLLPVPEREMSGPGQRILSGQPSLLYENPVKRAVSKCRRHGKTALFLSAGASENQKPRRRAATPPRSFAALFRSPPRPFSLCPLPSSAPFSSFFRAIRKQKTPGAKSHRAFFFCIGFCRTIGFFPENPLPGTFLAIFLPERLCGNSPRKNRFRSGETGQYPYR